MKIWHGNPGVEELNKLNKGTMGEALQITFTEIGEDYITATMPVNSRVQQPFGLLHGGASVALAETVGSVASWCAVNRELFIGVGVEINANHLRMVRTGEIKAVCKPLRVEGKVHVWDIRLYDESQELCCVCRFTCMVVPAVRK